MVSLFLSLSLSLSLSLLNMEISRENLAMHFQDRLEAMFTLKQLSRDWARGLSAFEWLTEDEMKGRNWSEIPACNMPCLRPALFHGLVYV